jgi:hypothetical protein
MAVSLGFCKKHKMKVCVNTMPKRISESKKLEGTVIWGKLHKKDHSVFDLFFRVIKMLNKRQVAIYHAR